MRLSNVIFFGALLSAGGLLTSCGSPPQGAAQPGAVAPPQPPGASNVRPAGRRISWMGRGVQQRDLLYVSNADGTVSVYRYWQHTLVGVLTSFTQPLGECAHWLGDVYITDRETRLISEYPHGGTKPINVLTDPPKTRPMGCSVDRKSGDVAVANNPGRYNHKPGNIAIFLHGQGSPVIL